MPKKLQAIRSVPINLVEAIRRANLRRGVFVAPAQADAAAPAKTNDSKENKQSDSPKSPPELTGSQEPQEVHEQLIDITEKAQDVLFKADTIFPFTIFPDTITIDREKLTIATRAFFRVARITSAPISSISSAEATLGPFLGSVHISSKYFVNNTYAVNFLSRSNALKIQHLLQGFIIAQDKGIDLTDIDESDLKLLLTDLGQGVSD